MTLTPNFLARKVLIKKLLPIRIYQQYICDDLKHKMVFIGGPRQVGKTTLATGLIKNYRAGHPAYLNWDNEEARRVISKGLWSKDEPLIVFDELHKRKGWQALIKGQWDTWKDAQNYVVTGSARLDVFRKGGDSMLGRYHYFRLHPYTLPELGHGAESLNNLYQFGGFPEPLIQKDERNLRRWHLQRVAKLVRIDLRDIENVSDLDKVELLANVLPEKVGSPLSFRSLAEDLETSDKTVKRWVQILDSLYYCYLIAPFGSARIKAVKKAQKLYLWDWSQVMDSGARFENMVASHLLKLCHFWEDVEGHKSELRYIRDENGREVDFVVLKDRKPLFAVECKLNKKELSNSLCYFKQRLNIPRWYQVYLGDKSEKSSQLDPHIQVVSFGKFCMLEKLC